MSDYTFVEVIDKINRALDEAGREPGTFCDGVPCKCCILGNASSYYDRLHGTTCNPRRLLNYIFDNPETTCEYIMNYKVPVDWTKVPVDTKILVKDSLSDEWLPRYFAKYDEQTDVVYAWSFGATSFSISKNCDAGTEVTPWLRAKLYEEEIL